MILLAHSHALADAPDDAGPSGPRQEGVLPASSMWGGIDRLAAFIAISACAFCMAGLSLVNRRLPMQMLNIHNAKTHLSQLIRRAIAGEEIVIGKAGTPLVTLVPFQARVGKRKGGQWCGRVFIAEDFDELPEELASAFRGEQL